MANLTPDDGQGANLKISPNSTQSLGANREGATDDSSTLRDVADWPLVSGDRYEVVEPLGRGGMGTVYLARDTVLDREVALKIVERRSDDAGEARILARLEHPGIVPVHDCGELPDGRLFYAMKRVRGDRLDRWMASGRAGSTRPP